MKVSWQDLKDILKALKKLFEKEKLKMIFSLPAEI